ncbi:MAG: hypothetical protein Ct9H300mP23_07480 [Nitrospinota bacterium]|nr:MAG: hypothetical protein Ct9H300mP23_07480 [Nitrospinota bacterium]
MSEELYYPPESVHPKPMLVVWKNTVSCTNFYKIPRKFWAEQAEHFCWFRKWDQVRSYNMM